MFNWRYLGRAVDELRRRRIASSMSCAVGELRRRGIAPSGNCAVGELRRRGTPVDPAMLARLSPLGWDRINLTGDYVWSDRLDLDADGLMPLLIKPLR
ncbi:Tn3 family transposase [Rhodopila sp.]|uniref:Tn3 family transposase n=1 Tax=Rhodopila sp. TaxID=2480087 RepID=UPI003D0FDCAC